MSVNSWAFDPDHPALHLVASLLDETGLDRFDLAVILGSGWGEAFTETEVLAEYAYSDWPCFPIGRITGHSGQLKVVRDGRRILLLFFGRFHCYQGLSAYEAALPVRIAAALGCQKVLLTCATGGINPAYSPGDYMLVADHINLLGDNPLRGLGGDPFIDLGNLYRTDFFEGLRHRVSELGIRLHRGVLTAMPGPSYETPAEIRMLGKLGADVVSMSTVPEAVMAHALGLEVAAIAMVANPAAGLAEGSIDHREVLACGTKGAGRSGVLLHQLLEIW